MTFCHIQLRKTEESNTSVTYAAISPDFNDKFLDEKMAIIVLNKTLKTYEFIPGGKWLSKKTLPPMFYSLPDKKQNEMLENEYKGYGNGAWTMRIHRWISQFIEEGAFPEKFPD
jgi:hypothetical protein